MEGSVGKLRRILERVHRMRMRKADWRAAREKTPGYLECREWQWGPGTDLSKMRETAKKEMEAEAKARADGTWVPKQRPVVEEA